MLKLTLTTGETIVGTPNYVTERIAQIHLAEGNGKLTDWRVVPRHAITRVERPKRGGDR